MTAAKIYAKHSVSDHEVRAEIECVEGLRGSMDEHPEHGARLMIQFTLRGKPALAVLFDAKHPMGDVWNLGSVYFRRGGA
ncbi:MAG: hypothetical protein JJD92_06255 [Frankiaceae bacterium]|nr:hypothetical protein [Frankiaceae bacterium]